MSRGSSIRMVAVSTAATVCALVVMTLAQGPADVAIVGATLVDGTGSAPVPNSVILVRGDRIARVGRAGSISVPAGATVLMAEGMTVIPGLWDLHVHTLYAGSTDLAAWHRTYTPRFEKDIMPGTAMQLLRAGVTSVRDMGAPPDAIFAVKQRIARGELDGPTIYAAGPQLTHMPPDWASVYRWGVSGAADAGAKARQLLTRGADLLKITDAEGMAPDEIAAITAEAHRSGKRVAAHGRTNEEIRLGLAGGVDEFEHIGIGMTGPEYPEDLIREIRARAASPRPLYWAPTVGLPLHAEYLRDHREVLAEPATTKGLPPDVADTVTRAVGQFTPQVAPATPAIIKRKVSQLQDAKVRLLIGTDSGLAGNPHSLSMWQELDAWVHALGMDPMTVIVRATADAAAFMGASRDVGTITAGKYADLVAVRGNPLADIDVLRTPSFVLKHGKRIN